jgi:RHS repeat-associated protein
MKTSMFPKLFLKNLSLILLLNVSLFAQNIPNNSATGNGTETSYLPLNYASGIKVNSLKSIAVTVPTTDEASIDLVTPTKSRVVTQYSDGLARPIQTVRHYGSPGQRDEVTTNKYDNIGNQPYNFLSYTKAETSNNGKFKLTAFVDQKNFYKGGTLNYTNDFYFYTKTNFEASPLNRVLKTLDPGISWAGKDKGKTAFESALPANANIRIFTIAYAPGSLPVTSRVYDTGELQVETVTDEDGFFVEEYKNKENQIVLRTTGKTGNTAKLQTYYVYDYMGMLRYIITPKAVTWLSTNNWVLNAVIGKELCFSYEYDYRLRTILKTKPGAGAEWFVYNQKDELVFSQTPLQRAKGVWIFTKYDVLGRLIQSGIYNSTANQATMHNYVNTYYSGTDPLLQYINKDVYGSASYINTFTTAKVYTTNYYDDYSFTTRTYDASYMSKLPTAGNWNGVVSTATTNLLTGTKVVLLDGAATPTELVTVNFYNDRGLLLQTQTQNHKGGWNFITNCYDFINQKLGTCIELNNPQASDNLKITTVDTYIYDNSGRVKEIYQSLNNQSSILITHNNYDELGRLKDKTFANADVASIVYDYNVRNWLTGINRTYCLNGGTGSSETFGMELNYDYGYTANYLNGNIAGIKWRNSGKVTELRSYGYTYDSYNRLRSGDFALKTGVITSTAPWSNATKDYTASNMNYDENGNLQSMKQIGLNLTGQKIILDDLQYTYNSNSNRIQKVSELTSSQSINPTVYDNLGDFRDVAATVDYTYDANGNVLTDANKSLVFTYDELVNKTKRVTKGTQNVDYLYDAAGNKLQKKVSGGSATTITDYIGGAAYINNSLSFISHSEGRIRYNSTGTTKYMYDYFIKDHLGSTRSVVTYTAGAITGFAKTESNKSTMVNYVATSEPANAGKENQLFDNIDNTRSVKPNNKTGEDNYVAKISSKSSKTIIGPDITLKVMAGDTVNISAEALYIAEKNNLTDVTKNVINNFITAFISPLNLNTEGLNVLANNNMNNLASAILNMQQKNSTSNAPNAFLNYVMYDEYMNLIPTASGALQVKNKDGWQTLETDKFMIPQNGFLRVFSNNMETAPVSINNTTVGIITGKLVEEYNYYPYGLVFDQTQVASTIKKTDYLYNTKELQHNEFGAGNGLELADYGARLYDSQIGRWLALDPMSESRDGLSPYSYCQNNPINRIDPNGALDDDFYLNKEGKIVGYVPTDEKDRIFQEDENGTVTQVVNGANMNFTEVENPSFSIVKTYIDPTGVGHTAIGMDGEVVGFYPTTESPGAVFKNNMTYKKKYTTTEFEERYGSANIFFMKVSNNEKESIKNSLIGMMGQVDAGSAPKYAMFSSNCTTQACNALNAANLPFKSYNDFDGSAYNYGKLNFVAPISLNSFMKEQYENSDIGSPVKAWMDRGNIVRPNTPGDQLTHLSRPIMHN